MFTYFNETETTSTKNNLKVRVQVEVEIEESIGKLITGGAKDFQFNTDKKTVITASISPIKSPKIVSELYKVISQVVVEEFNIKRFELNDPKKIIVESKKYKLEILIFNVIVHPQTILDKIIERLSETDIISYTESNIEESRHDEEERIKAEWEEYRKRGEKEKEERARAIIESMKVGECYDCGGIIKKIGKYWEDKELFKCGKCGKVTKSIS